MKSLQQTEALGLLILAILAYSQMFPHAWTLFAILFLAPDLGFIGYAFSKKTGAYVYNTLHHQGLLSLLVLVGWILDYSLLQQIGIIFLAHSFFDRAMGYGLKYTDSFHHTHLGWIGKNKTEVIN
jgi:Domain of unknown function (DUF4260)